MNNKQEFYSNFQCYDKKGNRYAIFGREGVNSIQIFTLKCNRKDQFNKNIAKDVYETWLVCDNIKMINSLNYHPNIYNIAILQENKPMFTFNQYCKNNYYHKYEQDRVYKEVVLKKDKQTIVLSAKRYNKLDKSY